jgi:hypothetical protein
MLDPTKRCMHCAFFDDLDSKCKAHPPVYAGDTVGSCEDNVTYFTQPVIDCEWSETCGEWQAAQPNKTADERMAEIRLAADSRAEPPTN